RESAWFDMVRIGLAGYGLSPLPQHSAPPPRRPRPPLTPPGGGGLAKPLVAVEGVAYGHTHVARTDGYVALLPLGYGDGIPRHASNKAAVWIHGHRYRIAGRVSMDQFTVDTGDHWIEPGR